jgi:hypothetical protein
VPNARVGSDEDGAESPVDKREHQMQLRGMGRVSAVVVLLALVTAAALTGCNKAPVDTEASSATAKGSVDTARSALSTMAPDAKLLVAETAAPVVPDSAPQWSYVFGSPKTGDLYGVVVADKTVARAGKLGKGPLAADEWKSVPGLDEWKVDSDEAYGKALAANGTDTNLSSYTMVMETYVPRSVAGTVTTKPFVWNVYLQEGSRETPPKVYRVDAKTGAVTKGK